MPSGLMADAVNLHMCVAEGPKAEKAGFTLNDRLT